LAGGNETPETPVFNVLSNVKALTDAAIPTTEKRASTSVGTAQNLPSHARDNVINIAANKNLSGNEYRFPGGGREK
jgi:hypothetical protein